MNVLTCPVCKKELARPGDASGFEVTCQNCQSPVTCVLFRGHDQSIAQGIKGKPVTEANEASCYNHSTRQASSGCETCGRLICPVCEIKVSGKSVCPTCLGSAGLQESLPVLITQRVCYEKALWFCAGASIHPSGFIMAPAVSLYLFVLAYLNGSKPGSLTGGKGTWTVVSVLIGIASVLLWIGFWGLFIFIIIQIAQMKQPHR